MGEFELPFPLTERQQSASDAYRLRYPGIDISPGRVAWRGQHEIERGRITRADLESASDDLSRLRRAEMTMTTTVVIDGRQVRTARPIYS